MTEIYTCTDCSAEIDFDQRREHMKDEHGVNYSLPEQHCAEPCERAKVLES